MVKTKVRGSDPPSPPWVKTVDTKKVIDDLLAKKLVSPRAQFAFLPYYEEISKSIDEHLEHLETGLVISCILGQQKSVYEYLEAVDGFISEFGLWFKKEQQLKLLKTAYLIMTKEGQSKKIVSSAADLLESLVDESLTHRDIELDWNVIYNLYVKMPSEVKSVARDLKRFYAPAEIKKIWEKLKTHNTPGNKKKFFEYCVAFLPDHLNGEDQKKYGAVHWWDTLWKSFVKLAPKSSSVEVLPRFFSEVIENAPDFMDWSPLYEEFITRLLGSIGLTMGRGDGDVKDTLEVPQQRKETNGTIMWNFGRIVGDLLGGPRSITNKLKGVMTAVEKLLQSSLTKETRNDILKVMKEIAERVKERFQSERIYDNSQKPKNFSLRDDDVEEFVSYMLPSAMEMMFSEELKKEYDCHCDGWSTWRMCDTCELVRILAFLSPNLVLPKLSDKVNKVLDINLRPRQIKHILTCIIGIAEDIRAIGEFGEHQNVWSKYVSGVRIKMMKLLEALTAPEGGQDVFKTKIHMKNVGAVYRMLCFEMKERIPSDEFAKLACRTLQKTLNTINRELIKEKKREMRRKRGIYESESDEEDENGDANDANESDEEEKYDDNDGEAFITRLKLSVLAFLEYSPKEVQERFVEIIYKFIASNDFEQFESATSSTWVYQSILKQVVLTCPDSFPRFATFFLEKLKLHVTPKIRRKKELTSAAKWYLDLTEAIFSTTAEALIEHKELCFEIVSLLLLDYECSLPYWAGCSALFSSLFTLTRTYAVPTESNDEKKVQYLNTWHDRQEWPHEFQEIHGTEKMSWHVPDETCRSLAEELICRFVFPVFETIRNPDLEEPHLMTLLDFLVYTLKAAHPCFVPSKATPDPQAIVETGLPSPKCSPIRIPKPNLKVAHPSGKNVHEMVLEVCEHLLDRLEGVDWKEIEKNYFDKGFECSRKLKHIVWLLRDVFTNRYIDFGWEFGNFNRRAEEIFKFNIRYPDAMAEEGEGRRHAYYSALHFLTVAQEPSEPCNAVQKRAIDLFLGMICHESWVVRDQANTPLWTVLQSEVPEYQADVVDKVVELLENGVSYDQLGCLSMTIGMIHRWAEWNDDNYRIKMWKALAGLRALDLPGAAKDTNYVIKYIDMYRIPRSELQLKVGAGECENYCYNL